MKTVIAKRKKGTVMVMVLILMAVTLALCSSIVFSASALMAGNMRRMNKEQAKILANDFSDTIGENLSVKLTVDNPNPNTEISGRDEISVYVYNKLNKYCAKAYSFEGDASRLTGISPLEYWFDYDTNDDDTRHGDESLTKLKTTTLINNADASEGLLTVTLYWKITKNIPGGDKYLTGDINLYIETKYEYEGESHIVTAVYSLNRTIYWAEGFTASNGEYPTNVKKEEWTWQLIEKY